MSLTVRTVEYYYTRAKDNLDNAYQLLEKLASEEVNLLAFGAVPYGSGMIELQVFPDRAAGLLKVARELGWDLTGPQHAILVQGDDSLGALADIHRHLREANVDIYASTGVTDGQGRYGYVIYVKEDDFPTATKALMRTMVSA